MKCNEKPATCIKVKAIMSMFLPLLLSLNSALAQPEKEKTEPESFLAEKTGKPPTIPLNTVRRSGEDLCVNGPILGFDPGTSLYLAYEDLLKLPTHTLTTDLVWMGEKRKALVLPLEELRNALGLENVTDLVVVDCNDGYQAIFGAKVLKQNKPFLVLQIEGTPPGVWGLKEGAATLEYNRLEEGAETYAHYLNVETEKGLIDPDHKKPWGVTRLEFTRREVKFGELFKGNYTNLSEEASLGREIYLGSCYCCHAPMSGNMGGSISDRKLELLAAHAKYNQQYFLDWTRDPQGQMKGVKMSPHLYGEEQMNQLISFLKVVP